MPTTIHKHTHNFLLGQKMIAYFNEILLIILLFALVIQLPELTNNAHGHTHGSGSDAMIRTGTCHSASKFALIMSGFFVGFTVLFILALFEDNLDTLVSTWTD